MIRICSLLLIVFILQPNKGVAQTDSLRLNIKQAEELFIRQNYDLLAGSFQIEQARAEIITAKLFDNPELNYENLFYNHETRKFFQTSYANGQYAASVSQLFKLAGKRNKNIQLARLGSKLAELSYFDLLRTLKYELHRSFFDTYFNAQSVKVYQQQIKATDQLLNAYELQLQMGNVASKDVIRIKSLAINLKAELTGLLNDLEDSERDLKLLCGLNANTALALVASLPDTQSAINVLRYSAVLDSARMNRSDLKLAQTDLEYEKMNFKLQKAMAVPDLELSLSYDYKGNFPEKYTGLGIKIPIPLFNRNQGEVKKAIIGIDAAKSALQKQKLTLENEVLNTYQTVVRNEKLAAEIDPGFTADFDKLIAALLKNFKERNVSLFEFLDLFDAYKENTLQINKIQQNKMNARAELNFVTGTTLFK